MNDDNSQPWYTQRVDRVDLLAVAVACAALAITELTPSILS